STHTLLESVRSGATDPAITGVDVVVRPALTATAVDVLGADGYVLGTPANLGYMAGALKHFFDQIYYPCLDATVGRPYAAYVQANTDTPGALRATEAIPPALRGRRPPPPVAVLGEPARADVEACWELGATVAALLAEGMA